MTLLQLDSKLTFFLYDWAHTSTWLDTVLRDMARIFIYLLPLILLWLFFRSYKDRLNSVKIFLSAILAWQIFTTFVGALFYNNFGFRDRPFASLGFKELFLEQPQKSFPSDHSAVMMVALLAFFGYKYPKLGWLFLIGGLISSLGRVTSGFHYVGDILGGWLLGLLAYLIIRALAPQIDKISTTMFAKLPYFATKKVDE